VSSDTQWFAGLDRRPPHAVASLDQAEAARNRATCRLREAEHWRRLVEARLDLAVAAVTEIDDLDAGRLRELVGVPCGVDRLGESTRLLPLRAALGDLDVYITELRSKLDDASARVAESIVSAAS
jgi:hypothetical protein